jgi:hypothetical protein
MGHGRAIGKARAQKWDRDCSRATPQSGFGARGRGRHTVFVLFVFSFLSIVCSVIVVVFFFFWKIVAMMGVAPV